MKKLVCTKSMITEWKVGQIYTLTDEVKNEGYGNFHKLAEMSSLNSWVSETFIKHDFAPAENIKASVTLTWGDGRVDKRYFVDNTSAEAFQKEARKVISKHHRKNAAYREPQKTLESSVIEYNVSYAA